ncbi:MAG: hypothetical protein KAG19_05360 [Methylococcales bacterium]|nr:hypothetical protein [Methylococcales bacterium]
MMGQESVYISDLLKEQREGSDRRDLSVNSLLKTFGNGQRVRARRREDVEQGYYTDHYETYIVWSAAFIILLSAMDAFFTLNILQRGGVEVNPFMLALLEYDNQIFLLGKMIMTIVCVLFSLIHINFSIFNMFTVKVMLKSILFFYMGLIGYEIFLLTL